MPKKQESFEVEKLCDVRKNGKEFLVKWKGYPASENTWEPAGNLGSVKKEMKALLGKATAKPKAPIAKAKKPAKAAAKKPAAKGGKKVTIDVVAVALLIKQSMTGIKAPEPKKKAAGAKAKGEAVVNVEKITGMKVTKKDGVMYKILWEDKSTSWEVEDNVMDEDLIDDFEESKQIATYGGEKLEVGSEIEVKNVIEGFENSWSAATVEKKAGSKFTVKYTSFEDDDGEPLVESGLERKRLRLAPDAADASWSPVVGEIVEVSDLDCWWEARVEGIPSKGKLTLKFRVSDEIKTMSLTKKVRPCSWLTLE